MRQLVKYGLVVIWVLILLTPIVIFLRGHTPQALNHAGTAFPLFGLIAFTLVWSQIMFGAFMRPLEKIYPRILPFHIIQGLVALGFAFLHPLLLIVSLGGEGRLRYIDRDYFFVSASQVPYVYLGQAALLLLILGLAAGLLRKWAPIQRHWHWIHLVHYVVFFLVFFHSWNLGSDIQTTAVLRGLWLFYLVTVIIGLIYRRIIIPSRDGLVKATS